MKHCGELLNAASQEIHNGGSIPEGARRTSKGDFHEGADGSQPPPPTGGIRPIARKVVPGRSASVVVKGRLRAGVAVQGGSIHGGHRPYGAEYFRVRW